MKRIINIAILLLTAVMAAQAASFTVEAPRQVVEGNKFNVTFVLSNGEGSSFTPPEVTGAKLIYGPSVSHSYSSSWVNGKSSSSSSEEYTMIYKATQSGKCHIGPASIVVGGKRMATRALTIEVLPSGSSQPSQQTQRTPGAPTPYSDPMTQSADKEVSGKDLFVRIEMSKPRVYEQQAVAIETDILKVGSIVKRKSPATGRSKKLATLAKPNLVLALAIEVVDGTLHAQVAQGGRNIVHKTLRRQVQARHHAVVLQPQPTVAVESHAVATVIARKRMGIAGLRVNMDEPGTVEEVDVTQRGSHDATRLGAQQNLRAVVGEAVRSIIGNKDALLVLPLHFVSTHSQKAKNKTYS